MRVRLLAATRDRSVVSWGERRQPYPAGTELDVGDAAGEAICKAGIAERVAPPAAAPLAPPPAPPAQAAPVADATAAAPEPERAVPKTAKRGKPSGEEP